MEEFFIQCTRYTHLFSFPFKSTREQNRLFFLRERLIRRCIRKGTCGSVPRVDSNRDVKKVTTLKHDDSYNFPLWRGIGVSSQSSNLPRADGLQPR